MALVLVFLVLDLSWQTFKIIKFGNTVSAHLAGFTQSESEYVIYAKQLIIYLFIAVRLGTFAVMLSSLRALPEGCYTSVKWVTSIPHV